MTAGGEEHDRGSAAAVPPLSGRAAAWTLIDLDSAGPAIAGWSATLAAAGVPHDVVRVPAGRLEVWIADADGELTRWAVSRRVGWRVAAAGPGHGVAAVGAAAGRVGLLPEEVVLHADRPGLQRLYCPVCAATTSTHPADVDRRCGGCGIPLIVHDQLSLTHGRHLASADLTRSCPTGGSG